MMNVLVCGGADVNVVQASSGQTVLMVAASEVLLSNSAFV